MTDTLSNGVEPGDIRKDRNLAHKPSVKVNPFDKFRS
jgi:hypothetical protein